MRKLVVSEWMALDGVFDADTMDQWFHPYQSDERAASIQEGFSLQIAFSLGGSPMTCLHHFGGSPSSPGLSSCRTSQDAMP